MKIFVTGGTGFIGSHFINKAHEAGHELVCLRRLGSQSRIPLIREPIWVEGNLEDDLRTVLKECDALAHFAACGVSPQKSTREDLLRWNVQAPYYLLQDAKISGVKNYIITGTFAEYGLSGGNYEFIPTDAVLMPTSSYAASKASFLQLLYALSKEENIKVVYARIFYAFGEGQYEGNFWPSLKKAALAGEDFYMTPGEQVRDFISVEDVAEQLVNALSFSNLSCGQVNVRNIGSGHPQTLREFGEFWWEKWGATGNLHFGSKPYRKNEVMRCVPKID